MNNLEKALALASLGMKVFPCRGDKTPYPEDGFYSASDDPQKIENLWLERMDALVGVYAGGSGLCVLDIDVKTEGGTTVVDGWEALELEWLAPPETFSYYSVNGNGAHFVYLAPADKEGLNPKAGYRGMKGVDRRAGGSYVVWAGDVPESRDLFTPAPEWLLDTTEVRSRSAFEGTVKDWYETLEPGEPNLLVRRAIDRVADDFSHSQMVEAQHEAIRLGAEGNPGVPELLDRLEQAWLNRPGENHSTPEEKWEYKFAEALASGIQKHGDSITLRKDLPEYSPSLIPQEVPDSLITGLPGDKQDFNALLSNLVRYSEDDLQVTSILWSAPKTRELSREWGLQFVNKRVLDARTAPPPVKENPTLPDPTIRETPRGSTSLLSEEEVEYVLAHPSFIDEYLKASHDSKGWSKPTYDIPAAWTLLSMAFGFRAFIPKGKGIPLNLWFITLGYSGTGKSVSNAFLGTCLDLTLKHEDQTYYNLGAGSSPEAMHEALLERDRKPSMVHHDEASDFFENLQRKDWMSGLKDNFSKWYDGFVPPVQKVRYKELKGKSALTSFNLAMLATPDRLLDKIDTSMFESGFLARVNWSWGEPPEDGDQRKYLVHRADFDDEGTPPAAYDLISGLLFALRSHKAQRTAVDWTEEAEDILIRTHMRMDEIAKSRDFYEVTEPGVTRLGAETTWKCAALLALYRGDRVIQAVDALTAVYYVQNWFDTMFRVVEAAGHGEFAHKMDEMEAYIRKFKSGVSEAKLYDRFKGLARFSRKDIDSLVEYLMVSGRILVETSKTGVRKYVVNGG